MESSILSTHIIYKDEKDQYIDNQMRLKSANEYLKKKLKKESAERASLAREIKDDRWVI
jgi:protein-arginine kinase activator protein McsA